MNFNFTANTSPPLQQSTQTIPSSQNKQPQSQLELLMFYQTQQSNLFPISEQYPAFFNQNLTNPNRIIKSPAKSPHSNIQVFYFHLLLLGFQFDDFDGSKAKIVGKFKQHVLSEEFQILFTRDTEEYRQIFNNGQFKKLFYQFFTLLEGTVEPVETALSRLPIMDTIMIHIIRSFLFYLGVNEEFEKEIVTETVFTKLAQSIGMRLTCYQWEEGACWKFEDSDMFCLDEGEGKLYLAYIPTNESKTESSRSQLVSGKQSQQLEQSSVQNIQLRIEDSQQIVVEPHYPPSVSSHYEQVNQSFQSQKLHTVNEIKPELKPMPDSLNQLNQNQMNKFNISNNQSLNLGSETFLHIINNFDNCRITEYAVAEASSSDAVIRNVEYDSQNVVAFEPTNDTTIKFEPNSGLLFSFSRLPQQEDIVIEPTIPISTSSLSQMIIQNQTPSSSKINSHSNISSNPEQSIRWNFFKNKNVQVKKNSSIEFEDWKPSVGYQKQRERVKMIADNYKQKSISDYYNDFTSSFTLNAISEPYRSQVKNIKMRVKGSKKF